MPELHLMQLGIIYRACVPLTKHWERIKKIKETGDLKHIFRSELDKACFAHDAAYTDSKDLAKRTISDKIWKERVYEIAINLKYDEYQRGLASMAYKCFDKKTGSEATVNEELPQKLRKSVIKTFKRRKVYARFKYNIWAADLAKMRPLSSKNRGVKYLLCVIDVFSKYDWVESLKGKKAKTFVHDYIEI